MVTKKKEKKKKKITDAAQFNILKEFSFRADNNNSNNRPKHFFVSHISIAVQKYIYTIKHCLLMIIILMT